MGKNIPILLGCEHSSQRFFQLSGGDFYRTLDMAKSGECASRRYLASARVRTTSYRNVREHALADKWRTSLRIAKTNIVSPGMHDSQASAVGYWIL